MHNVLLRRYITVSVLQHIGDRHLIELLSPHRAFLEMHRFFLPATPQSGRINYEQLADVLLRSEADLPPELTQALLLIRDLATPENMDKLQEAAAEYRVDLGLGADAEPADVAARFWILNRPLAERVHAEHAQQPPRAVSHFYARSRPLPAFKPPDMALRRAMEADLKDWFDRRWRGPAIEFFIGPGPVECLFVVLHGQTCRRFESLDRGQPGTVAFRPQQRDLLGFNWARGELRIHAAAMCEREFYRSWFGFHLFGQRAFFPREATYTLKPLIRDGEEALNCLDVEGLEWVRLQEVEMLWPGSSSANREREVRKANDLLAVFKRRGFRFQHYHEILRAVFCVKLKGSETPQRVMIQPDKDPRCERDDDNGAVDEWLVRRGFILNEGGRNGSDGSLDNT